MTRKRGLSRPVDPVVFTVDVGDLIEGAKRLSDLQRLHPFRPISPRASVAELQAWSEEMKLGEYRAAPGIAAAIIEVRQLPSVADPYERCTRLVRAMNHLFEAGLECLGDIAPTDPYTKFVVGTYKAFEAEYLKRFDLYLAEFTAAKEAEMRSRVMAEDEDFPDEVSEMINELGRSDDACNGVTREAFDILVRYRERWDEHSRQLLRDRG